MSAVLENNGSMVFCRACGRQIHVAAAACPCCGAPQSAAVAGSSEKRILPALLLCLFLGIFGVHRFYAGKIGTGVLQLLTVGGLGIWALIDFVLILTGAFRDGDGKKITQWT